MLGSGSPELRPLRAKFKGKNYIYLDLHSVFFFFPSLIVGMTVSTEEEKRMKREKKYNLFYFVSQY